MNSLPLQGVRILAVEQLMALPFGTQILSDLGAEVVAVETVGYAGDDNVPWRERTGRHKRRIQVRLNDPRGQEILRRLAGRFDVFGENFRPGIMDKYQLGYSQLSTLNERLVYVSVSGFGHRDFLESPYSSLASYGNIGEAVGGTLHAVRAWGGEHTGVASGDITTTLFATIGILAALRHRDLTGKGQYVDVAMADSLFAMSELTFYRHMLECESQETGSKAPQGVSYPNGTFAAADGEFTMLILSDAHWQSFCKMLEHEEWLNDPEIIEPSMRKAAVETRVLPVLKAWSKALTRAAVVQRFRAAGLAAAPVNGPKDIAVDPHFAARHMIETIVRPNGKPIRVAGNPIKMSAAESAREKNQAPIRIERPGESTRAVLGQELGLSDADLEALNRDGVVGWPPPTQTGSL
jgi:CoA:oxalate CoA-transferase